MKPLQNTGSLIASTLAAFGASICCLGPLLLLAAGVGGSSSLGMITTLEPFRPFFIAITLGLLALAYYKIFWRKTGCENCNRGQKMVFWVIAVLSLLMLAVPWFM